MAMNMKKMALLSALHIIGYNDLPVSLYDMQGHRSRGIHKDKVKTATDKVLEKLVTNGVCGISDYLYDVLKDSLQSKLRGTVLFHCDIETRSIFVTYEKCK